MPTYIVQNRETKERWQIEAPYAQTACEKLGLMIGNCFVKCIKESPFTNITSDPIKLDHIEIPCENCCNDPNCERKYFYVGKDGKTKCNYHNNPKVFARLKDGCKLNG